MLTQQQPSSSILHFSEVNMAYKRELIVNDGKSLTSYKKLLKVSDVCQWCSILEFDNVVQGGVTFTSNSDGSITLNGTASVSMYIPITSTDSMIPLSTNKKYLVIGCPPNGSSSSYFLYLDNGGALFNFDTGSGMIGSPTKSTGFLTIGLMAGVTVNNLVFKPQLFDLTEMYGAGNEPKTVEEFRTKFPNDLYDYSPRCWVKSYKTELVVNNGKTI